MFHVTCTPMERGHLRDSKVGKMFFPISFPLYLSFPHRISLVPLKAIIWFKAGTTVYGRQSVTFHGVE